MSCAGVGDVRFSQQFFRCSLSVATSRSSFSNAFSFFSFLSISQQKVFPPSKIFLWFRWKKSSIDERKVAWKVFKLKTELEITNIGLTVSPAAPLWVDLIIRQIPKRTFNRHSTFSDRHILLRSSFGSSSIFFAAFLPRSVSSPRSSVVSQKKNIKNDIEEWSEVKPFVHLLSMFLPHCFGINVAVSHRVSIIVSLNGKQIFCNDNNKIGGKNWL